jgi:ribonuclease HII
MYVIGTDEAGYGSFLGPLVISATLWRFDEIDFAVFSKGEIDSNIFSRAIESADAAGITIGDSKKLYHSGGSLVKLASAVLASVASFGVSIGTDSELFAAVAGMDVLPSMYSFPELSLQKIIQQNDTSPASPQTESYSNNSPNSETPSCPHVNTAASTNYNATSTKPIALPVLVSPAFSRGVFLDVKSNVVFPIEYNKLLEKYGSKGELLSHLTFDLVMKILDVVPSDSDEAICVFCDKHGGRNYYTNLLIEYFPDKLPSVITQSNEYSIYQIDKKQFRFKAKGESELPIALASMFSKLLRELAMNRFNSFWQSHIKNIKPTAGYPVDAKRFLNDIKEKLEYLQINMNEIWRNK